MDFLNKWEKKYGKHAIPHLTRYIIMTYIAGYLLALIGGINGSYDGITYLLMLDPGLILKGQVWRLVSWLLIPPSQLGIFTLIMLFVYYQLGSLLEQIWGDYLYNVYIFTGLIMTVVGAFILYAAVGPTINGFNYFSLFSTYYVSLSIFLGFAMTFPDQIMLFMFIIPLKIKYLAVVDVIYLIYMVYSYSKYGMALPVLVMILCSLSGTILFFLGTKGFKTLNSKYRQREFQKKMQQGKTVRNWQQQNRQNGQQHGPYGAPPPGQYGNPQQGQYGSQQQGQYGGQQNSKIDRTTFGTQKKITPVHRCAICGRTELDDPNLEFRFCTKCNGNYEYCSDHLKNHQHIQ